MSTHALASGRSAPGRLSVRGRHVAWLGAGLLFGFLVPFVFADSLELPRDLYYGIYATSVAAFFAGWARSTGQSVAQMLRRHWILATALGLVFAGVMAFMALGGEDPTARPGGIELLAAVAWRGVVYGIADGLLLSAFPILAVFAAFAGTRLRDRWAGKLAVGAVAMLASLAMTATYHVGYSDFRSAKVAKPMTGDLVWSLPTLATLNPIGAPIAHAGLHVTAVLHSYETDLFLPPHR